VPATSRDLVQRFELRGVTGAEFLHSYTSYILQREQTAAEQLLATPTVSDAQFQEFITVFGFGPAVVLDGSGRDLDVAPYSAGVIGTDLAQRYAHLASAVAGHPAVSNVVASAAQRVPIVAFATPFSTPFGTRIVSGAFDVSSQPMGLYLRHLLPYDDSDVFLVDATDQIIASNVEDAAGPLPTRLAAAARGLHGGSSAFVDRAGRSLVVVAVGVPDTPWRLVMEVPGSTLFESISEMSRLLPWLLLGALGLAGAGVFFLLVRTGEARLAADHAARTDLLTQLPNRRATSEALERLVADHRRYGAPLGILLLDVDHFKRINDRFGHGGGDLVLQGIASRIAGCLRTNDLVGRWGGEEFVLLLPHTDEPGIAAAAERIRRALASAPFSLAPESVTVSVSLGGTTAREGDTSDTLLARADAALYAAKSTGRDRAVVTERLGGDSGAGAAASAGQPDRLP
jgi:diguanylate cyclase (GGDEF)-like protein